MLRLPHMAPRLDSGANQRITTDSTDSTSFRKGSRGFWDSLADLFMPDEDRYTYAEGLRRGGYVLSVNVTDAQYDKALDILDDEGTIDIDERAQAWRSEGWTGWDQSKADYRQGTSAISSNRGATSGQTDYERTTGTGRE